MAQKKLKTVTKASSIEEKRTDLFRILDAVPNKKISISKKNIKKVVGEITFSN